MRAINIQIQETQGLPRQLEPVRFSVPFAQGELLNTEQLQLNRFETVISAQYQALGAWPDGSIRWLQVNCLLSMAANSSETLQLILTAQPVSQTSAKPSLTETAEHWLLQSAGLQYLLNKKAFTLTISQAEQQWFTQFELFGEDGTIGSFTPAPDKASWVSGNVYSELNLAGCWQLSDKELRSSLVLRFWHDAAILEVAAGLHNPARAAHNGGLWDLGDSGSVLFSAFNLRVDSNNSGVASIKTTPTADPIRVNPQQSISLLQASSGKANWDSKNHINANGETSCTFQGFTLITDNALIAQGAQAQPQAQLSCGTQHCSLAQAEFWQNFPSALTLSCKTLLLGLFPAIKNSCYELQGGERKIQKLALTFGAGTLHWLQAPLISKLAIDQYQSANAFPWFGPVKPTDPIHPLLKESLDGSANFFAKREVIDEFGWRNYGDIFADHESLYLAAEQPPYISHYNNQYDAIYGFARQFALTGDQRWFQLMDELARHVTDIDIYHTEQDRVEYNNGLFWHTDHYLPAHTATHRTYSRHNQTSSIPGQTGGGPATEHCYTTGLKYHYWLTGNQESKAAVVQLAEWMNALHGEAPGLFNQLWAIKSRELPVLLSMLKGQSRALYPFTRGTGNYITALLDAYDVTLATPYLQQCATVIRLTISVTDNIDARNLLNAEVAWSYSIMLTAVARYLQLKKLLGEFDSDFHYARQSFLVYCRWMRQHERLYLTAAEELEFPNDTWLAQDIRKAMLMFQAAELCPDEAPEFTAKANSWLTQITAGLAQSKERHFARVQIILLQNFGPHSAIEHYPSPALVTGYTPTQPKYPLISLLGRMTYKLVKGIISCRLQRERRWLKTRMKS